jgi:hypothetical protein
VGDPRRQRRYWHLDLYANGYGYGFVYPNRIDDFLSDNVRFAIWNGYSNQYENVDKYRNCNGDNDNE